MNHAVLLTLHCLCISVIVPVEEIQKEEFFGAGQKRIHTVADHYGIYRDLFGEAYFYPQFKLGVGYNVAGEEDMVNPVLYGNLLTPTEVWLIN